MNNEDIVIGVTAVLGFLFPPLWLVTLYVLIKIGIREWKRLQ